MIIMQKFTKIVDEQFTLEDIDCAITIALKIIDKKCQMDTESQALFMLLYDAVSQRENKIFDKEIYLLIDISRQKPCLETLDLIHQKRVYAMRMIPKPIMKAFKQKIRELVA